MGKGRGSHSAVVRVIVREGYVLRGIGNCEGYR